MSKTHLRYRNTYPAYDAFPRDLQTRVNAIGWAAVCQPKGRKYPLARLTDNVNEVNCNECQNKI